MERKSLILEPGGTREVYYNLRDCGQLDGMGASMKEGSNSTRTQWGHLFICLCLIMSFPIKKKKTTNKPKTWFSFWILFS